MCSRKWILAAGLLLALGVRPASAQPVEGGPLPGPLPLFPADNWWNLDISAAPLDPHSAAFISFVGGAGRHLHPDFGGVDSGNAIFGFPYIVVSSTQALQTVQFDIADESDGVGVPFYPIPAEAITDPHWIEGGDPGNIDDRSNSDRHMLIVDQDNKFLYELYNVFYDGTNWNAGSGAFFDMKTNNRRPEGWTSADAAGLAMLPGLIRYEEANGTDEIGHAFRVTVRTTNGHVYPASHTAGSTAGALPMGARLRLKATKDLSGFTPDVQRIFRAMQKYGLIVADNGSDMFISGTFDTRWDNDVLNPAFSSLSAADFEVVQLGIKTVVPPQVAFSSAHYSVGRGGVQAAITVQRTGTTSVVTEVHYSTSDGTGIAGTHYTTKSGTLIFPEGATTQTFTVPVKNGTTFDGNRTVLLSLSSPIGAVVGPQGTSVLTIVDAERAGALQFSAATYTVKQVANGVATVAVTRAGGAASGVSVQYATSGGDAIPETDYHAASGTLSFLAGAVSATFKVQVLPNPTAHGDTNVGLVLTNPTGGGTLGVRSTATLVIKSGDPEVQFSSPTYTVSEKVTQALVTVTRSGSLALPLTVDWTSGGVAESAAATGTLTFKAAVASQTFLVHIQNAGTVGPSESVPLALLNPSGGSLGLQSAAVLTITSADGTVSLNAARYSVAMSQPTATIVVLRTAPLTSPATVAYATSDGTAIAGPDYQPASGTLTFNPGVASLPLKIGIVKEVGEDVTETFTVALSSPTGANLGAIKAAPVNIVGNATAGLFQFSVSDYSVGASGPTATITVLRTGGKAAGAAVQYGTTDGTAASTTNYMAASGTLVFAEGQTTQTFTVGIVGNPGPENLNLGLFLQNPGSGGTLGPISTATLWIVP